MNLLKNNVAVALDQMSTEVALNFVKETHHELGFYKVGLELFFAGGKELIYKLKEYNIKIFLDLKLHDIPTTVAKSIQSLKDLEVDYLTLHLTGGPEMLKAAFTARNSYMPNTKLLGVSFLTSLDHHELASVYGLKDQDLKTTGFRNLFQIAKDHHIDGVVHSGEELALSNEFPFISVCPGIRFLDEITHAKVQDQKRVLDPASALNEINKNREIILVIGRSLTQCNLEERSQRIKYLNNLFFKT